MGTQSLLERVFMKCVESVRPAKIIRSFVSLHGNILSIKNFSVPLNRNCFVVGFGKAAYDMAVEIESIVGDHIQEGVISIPRGSTTCPGQLLQKNTQINVIEGAKYNIPDRNAFRAATNIKKLVETLTEKDVLLVLISGGGSALLPYPKKPITLEEKNLTIKLLISAGANIVELNSVRKALSELKGGKLAALAHPATTISLILSDIIEDPLEFIASGPTVLSNENYDQCAEAVLERYNLKNKVPTSVRQVVTENTDDEKVNTKIENLSLHNVLIGNNSIALSAAKLEIEKLGNVALILSNRVNGLTSELAEVYSDVIKNICDFLTTNTQNGFVNHIKQLATTYSTAEYIADISKKVIENTNQVKQSVTDEKSLVLICGGEPTVKVKGGGLGGRNQELALEMALRLHQLHENVDFMNGFNITFLSAGTDGIDGPTDAAGAFVNSDLVSEAISTNIGVESYLRNNDSYSFFCNFQNGKYHFITGPTGTNVMDLHFLIISKTKSNIIF